MSAIFGIIDFEGRPLKEEWIRSMQTDLAHRGPDGQGLYREPSVALGHMLLQVTPESIYDKSPYEEDGFVITANARLDEREAIMDRLNVPQEERDKITDPLLLLRSFRKFGKDFVKDIYGDFAFAIWDKNKRELFCARDQMGVKPFLYHIKDHLLVFSTELKSIVRLSFVKTKVDNRLLRDQAFNIWDQPQKTIWENIFRLAPAHTLLLNKSNLNFDYYWIPNYRPDYKIKTIKESSALLKNLLIRIIKDHTRGLSIVGIPLSGGLDSSTITALAVKKFKPINGKIISVSSVLDPKLINEGESDEMNYILELVKNETIIEPKFVYHSDLNFHNELLSNFEKQYSVLNSNYCLDEAIFKQLKLNNVRRVLSGIFGDYTATNRVINPYPYLILHCKIFSVNKLLVSEANNSGIPLSSLIKSKILIPFIPFSLLKFIYKIKGRKIVWGTKEIDLIPDSKEKKDLQRRILKSFKKIYHEESSITNKIWPTDHEPFYEEWDCGSSYYQLEITYPLADRRLVELLLRLPADHFMADGSVRGLIRKTMEGILPEKIRKRTDKITYSPGFHTIFRKEFQVFFLNLVKLELNRPTVPMIQISKFTEKLKDLINSERSIKFAGDYWVIIHLYIWLVFSHWIDNIQNIKHETQGKKKLD